MVMEINTEIRERGEERGKEGREADEEALFTDPLKSLPAQFHGEH